MKISRWQKGSMLYLVCIISFSVPLAIPAGCKNQKPFPSYSVCDISYGPDKENTVDISLPEGRSGATPVVILIHGGAWTGGDKSDFAYLRRYFFNRGFAAFAVNYRLARIQGTGLRNILDDMELAVTYVKGQSGYLIYSRDVIFIAGHSAGGHIAVLYAFSRAAEGTIRGVVSYCGLYDLTDHELEKYLKRMCENEIPCSKKPFDRIGFVAGPDRKSRMAYSPLFIMRDIPVLLFCGKMDDIIPWHQSKMLHEKMKQDGYDSTLYVYPDMGHDITPYYGKIMETTEQWFRDRF